MQGVGLRFAVGSLAALALPAIVLLGPSCSSSDDTTPAVAAEAGDETEVVADTSTPDTATCNLSANLLDTIPDASLADGASTTGVCLGCVQANCATDVTQCNANCDCQAAISSGLACYLKDPSKATSCVAQIAFGSVDQSVKNIGIQLFGCVSANCQQPCATDKVADGGI